VEFIWTRSFYQICEENKKKRVIEVFETITMRVVAQQPSPLAVQQVTSVPGPVRNWHFPSVA
jgi:hypothetical protein